MFLLCNFIELLRDVAAKKDVFILFDLCRYKGTWALLWTHLSRNLPTVGLLVNNRTCLNAKPHFSLLKKLRRGTHFKKKKSKFFFFSNGVS